ncbi:MAG: hypothetical protein ACD_65C00282G0002 [uncultured bacterium]|nr:MAG: hypothetical protein ACD_65C00282G0002 [uncultured bacterium]KKT02575.1 MAG: endoribonuclease L-PSP, TdcF protein [Candidatus Peregrinibacteria bacterium GW2011_GWF2_43_17]KKT20571.1 MAG: hypothetical protein UW03_C0002G0037 [Candidatus Peregrinibacteria bacterium GW2011_GWA2_43_8]HAU39911.1 reactive intermediate/imine deaminase [Candidatus Peregrinibacteria bacterium]
MKEIISTPSAPKAVGPYSQAVKANGFIFCSGQLPYAKEGQLISEDAGEQAKQCMENLKSILESIGSNLDKVVKTTIFLSDMNNFKIVNEIYGSFFKSEPPARVTIQVARLPFDVKVEIDAVAVS